MKNNGKGSSGLFTRILTIFVLTIVITAAVSLAALYIKQSDFYYSDNAEDLIHINNYLVKELEDDGERFAELIDYFKEHQEELCIPFEYPDSAAGYWDEFVKAFVAEFPGKEYGRDVAFSDLSDETKLLYARYEYLRWLLVFDATRDAYDLDYVYFVYPVEGKEDTMCYMFDGFKEETIIDGKSCLVVGFNAFQDPEIHKNMWYAWNEQKDPRHMDILNNEFGNVYSHSSPVIYDGRILGLITTENSVGYVRNMVLRSVMGLGVIFVIVLILGMIVFMMVIKRSVLNRLFRLGDFVNEYSRDKDIKVANEIRSAEDVQDELGNLATGIADMIDELKEYMDNLQRVTAEREKISAELSVATTIQASMLPRIFPPFPDRTEFDLFASMDPAKEVGGDFYDFFFVDDTHLALVMADVSGKGVPAALFMAISKALIKDRALEVSDPAEVLMNVNNMLCEENEAELFVTVWLGILDISTGEIQFTDAGHEFPVMVHRDSAYELVKAQRKKPPVATIEGIKYQTSTVRMLPGDVLFLYTDGVPEATNASDELYGMERMEEVLAKNSTSRVEDILGEVRKDVDAFVKDAPQFDDLTMLAIRLNSGHDS